MNMVKVLKDEEIRNRYPANANSIEANFTKKAIDNGYLIAFIKNDNLKKIDSPYVSKYIKLLLEKQFGQSVATGGFTDTSQLNKNILYCAFKFI